MFKTPSLLAPLVLLLAQGCGGDDLSPLSSYATAMGGEVSALREAYEQHQLTVASLNAVAEIEEEETRFHDEAMDHVDNLHHLADDAEACEAADGTPRTESGTHSDLDDMGAFLDEHLGTMGECQTADDCHTAETNHSGEFDDRADACDEDVGAMMSDGDEFHCRHMNDHDMPMHEQ